MGYLKYFMMFFYQIPEIMKYKDWYLRIKYGKISLESTQNNQRIIIEAI